MQQNIVFIGAGGAGVSSLVLLFHELGIPHIVAIDSHESELTNKLAAAGIPVIIGHGTYQVQQDDMVIYSDAAAESPEVLAAHAKTLHNHKRVFPPMSLFQFWGELSKYMQTIAIAGTHGKSTTTGLAATALATHHPEFGLGIVGAPINQRGHRSFIIGDGHTQDIKRIIEHILFPKSPDISNIMKQLLFVIEADEYNHHFLYLDTDYACITNIELDHADVYGTFENYLDTFQQFADKVKQRIFVLADEPGIQDFIVAQGDNKINSIDPQTFAFTHLLGAHNHSNASLALACASHLCERSDKQDIQTTLEQFQGLRRRGELLGHNAHGVPIITDYGHHPTELASTYEALQEKYPHQKITCLFQPHQARRVMEFWDAFVEVLQKFDTTVIYDIYAAREDLEELKAQFQTSESHRHSGRLRDPGTKGVDVAKSYPKSPDFAQLTSIDDLGLLFAQAAGGSYTTNFQDIQNTLESTTEGVIVIFAAGSLDWEVRKYLDF